MKRRLVGRFLTGVVRASESGSVSSRRGLAKADRRTPGRSAVLLALAVVVLTSGCSVAATPSATPARASAPPTAVVVATSTTRAAATTPLVAPTATPTVVTISPAELTALLAGPSKPLLFDTRDRASYDYGHLPGAVSLPSGELEARLNEIPKDRLAVFYCTGAT